MATTIRITVILFCSFLILSFIPYQNNYRITLSADNAICGYNDENSDNAISDGYDRQVDIKTSIPGDGTGLIESISQVVNKAGLKPNYKVAIVKNENNAYATIYNKQRLLIIDLEFLKSVNKRCNNEWAAISILAHEIGHHLQGHTVSGKGSHPATELEADEWSGWVLAKMGASLQSAKAAMNEIASQEDSETHPAKNRRLAAITKGWNRGKQN